MIQNNAHENIQNMLQNKESVCSYNELKGEVDNILNILSKVNYKKTDSYITDTITILKENGMDKNIEVVTQNCYTINFYNDSTHKENNVVQNFKISISENDYTTIIKNDKRYYKNIEIFSESKRIDIKNLFSKDMEVKDVYRYKLHLKDNLDHKLEPLDSIAEYFLGSKFNDQFLKKYENNKSDIKNIVLILESPHKDEYTKKIEFKPISPAQGTTGRNINNHLAKVVSQLLEKDSSILKEKTYRIIICNPVPYQTSLHCLHGEKLKIILRNDVWKAVFKQNDITENFKNRIEYYNPELIINSCTTELKPYINKFIKDNFHGIKLAKTGHPSCWNFKKYHVIV